MKIIVGLGNPGKKYENTRHNIGFLSIDQLITDISNQVHFSMKSKFNALIIEGRLGIEKVVLVKPLTYMNLSGEAVRPILDWFGASVEDLLVIYDDLDLPLGKIRLREKGSSGGHNGIKSIIQHTGTEKFKRIKIGIDRKKDKDVIDYVLTPFSKEESPIIKESLGIVSKAILEWIDGEDFRNVMNRFN